MLDSQAFQPVIASLITVWLQVQVLPRPPLKALISPIKPPKIADCLLVDRT